MSFTWSFSSLKDYVNCPRQYHEVKVLKNFTKRVTQEMTFGTQVHKYCEDYIGEGKPLPKNYEHFKPVLDELLAIPGERYPEYNMALLPDGTPCKFGSPDRWVRGIVDLLIVDKAKGVAHMIDYKTSKSARYADTKQLDLMATAVFAHFPEVTKIKSALLFVVSNEFVRKDHYAIKAKEYIDGVKPTIQRLEQALDTGVWNPITGPLCRFCPVRTCEHNRSI